MQENQRTTKKMAKKKVTPAQLREALHNAYPFSWYGDIIGYVLEEVPEGDIKRLHEGKPVTVAGEEVTTLDGLVERARIKLNLSRETEGIEPIPKTSEWYGLQKERNI